MILNMKYRNFWRTSLYHLLFCVLTFHVPFVGAMETLKQQPTGTVILTVNDKSKAAQTPVSVRFDAAMLNSLPQTSFITKTPWYKDPVKFDGPRLKDVLEALKVNGEKLTATALNDYKVAIPLADAVKYGAMLALRMDGKVLSVRDKGPVWLIYPFDAHPELNNTTYFSRAIWQLSSITIE